MNHQVNLYLKIKPSIWFRLKKWLILLFSFLSLSFFCFFDVVIFFINLLMLMRMIRCLSSRISRSIEEIAIFLIRFRLLSRQIKVIFLTLVLQIYLIIQTLAMKIIVCLKCILIKCFLNNHFFFSLWNFFQYSFSSFKYVILIYSQSFGL